MEKYFGTGMSREDKKIAAQQRAQFKKKEMDPVFDQPIQEKEKSGLIKKPE